MMHEFTWHLELKAKKTFYFEAGIQRFKEKQLTTSKEANS